MEVTKSSSDVADERKFVFRDQANNEETDSDVLAQQERFREHIVHPGANAAPYQ